VVVVAFAVVVVVAEMLLPIVAREHQLQIGWRFPKCHLSLLHGITSVLVAQVPQVGPGSDGLLCHGAIVCSDDVLCLSGGGGSSVASSAVVVAEIVNGEKGRVARAGSGVAAMEVLGVVEGIIGSVVVDVVVVVLILFCELKRRMAVVVELVALGVAQLASLQLFSLSNLFTTSPLQAVVFPLLFL